MKSLSNKARKASIIYIIGFLHCTSMSLKAQDYIRLKTGRELRVKIRNMDSQYINYDKDSLKIPMQYHRVKKAYVDTFIYNADPVVILSNRKTLSKDSLLKMVNLLEESSKTRKARPDCSVHNAALAIDIGVAILNMTTGAPQNTGFFWPHSFCTCNNYK